MNQRTTVDTDSPKTPSEPSFVEKDDRAEIGVGTLSLWVTLSILGASVFGGILGAAVSSFEVVGLPAPMAAGAGILFGAISAALIAFLTGGIPLAQRQRSKMG